ncbi:hypothetical protein K2D_38760 [Planctomycetes bacterium K2D]|nr:hypothetical protein K2D_38760 [Planctomycetes bacterium K2D]
MRPTSPSNRISRYYQSAAGLPLTHEPFAPVPPAVGRLDRPSRQVGGRIAGMAASVLQLAISALCVAGAVSTWLGHPLGISLTMAVFLGGLMFGTVSLLQLYSALAGTAGDTSLVSYDD